MSPLEGDTVGNRGGDSRGGDSRGGDSRGGDSRGGDSRGGDSSCTIQSSISGNGSSQTTIVISSANIRPAEPNNNNVSNNSSSNSNSNGQMAVKPGHFRSVRAVKNNLSKVLYEAPAVYCS